MILLLTYLLSFFPLINSNRCYLCSQETLPECIGDASIYSSVLQYYTEPCHGQCVLFRDEKQSIIRGCSWTYGHMTRKPVGWHEISPGIPAYFCDSFLCNNGTYIQPEVLRPMVLLASNNPQQMRYRSTWKQCYSCTERFQGCGEFLDLHYAMKYIRACPTSCVLFRNPNDLNCKLNRREFALGQTDCLFFCFSSNYTRLFDLFATCKWQKWSAEIIRN